MKNKLLRIIFLVLIFNLPGILLAKLPEQNVPVPISIMTFNIENGGTQISFKKVVEAIKKSGAGVVGIQEPWGNTIRLATELGWKYYNVRQHIVSRFPLYEPKLSQGFYAYIEILPGQFVAMANMHLPTEFYGPDLIKAGKSASEIEEHEKFERVPTALTFIKKLAALTKKGIPVFLTGDFNSGSHLDWMQNTVGKLPNHSYVVEWPITHILQKLGFVDSYHQVHPDTLNFPGYTWPAQRPYIKKSIDHFNPSKDEIQERIDFIFFSGKSRVIDSNIVGETKTKGVNLAVEPWPSDHRAVISRFEVFPVRQTLKKCVSTSMQRVPPKTPMINISKKLIKAGEALVIGWNNAPGNRYDYIDIRLAESQKIASVEPICIYTNATINGSIRCVLPVRLV